MRADTPVVCLASVDWAFNWQIPQEVATGLAAAGHRVLYVENTGVRSLAWGDVTRLTERAGNWWHARGRPRATAPGVDVLAPIMLPWPYTAPAWRLNAAWLTARIQRWLAPGAAAPILITFLPTPVVAAVRAALRPALAVYYCTDRLAESSPSARRIAPHEQALMAQADVVLTTGIGLQRYAEAHASRAVLLPAGVRAAQFEAAAQAARSDPGRHRLLRGRPGPVVGFVGSLRPATDLALLTAAARLAPDLTFVAAGPVMADVRPLEACPNVVLTGPLSHADVVRWIAGFDVGVLPYLRTPFTHDLMPMKLKEYLAAGLPIVSTPLHEVHAFDAIHPGLITFADTAPAFVAALRAAIAVRQPDSVAYRQSVARQYDWTVQIATLRAVLDEAGAARSGGGR
ncbi:MAG: glycosyltransferase [Vicinamibacteraceae bacterium]